MASLDVDLFTSLVSGQNNWDEIVAATVPPFVEAVNEVDAKAQRHQKH